MDQQTNQAIQGAASSIVSAVNLAAKAISSAALAVKKTVETAESVLWKIREDRARLMSIHAAIMAGNTPAEANVKAAQIERWL